MIIRIFHLCECWITHWEPYEMWQVYGYLASASMEGPSLLWWQKTSTFPVWDSSWGSLGGDRTRADPTRLVCCPTHALPTLVPKKLKVNGTVSAVVRSTVQIKLHEMLFLVSSLMGHIEGWEVSLICSPWTTNDKVGGCLGLGERSDVRSCREQPSGPPDWALKLHTWLEPEVESVWDLPAPWQSPG